ncbi:sigma-54 dependent transcriptional regulator [Algoriphagus sp.]|uniref:sigma-54-dependent transcriptional regulator n=1 Tax=Algoriphagus sp. TaxID=1872435 RepID=UPI002615B1F9|nr:sigma-54 dependent transcriptional regulator [Algoriphagus sp.]
MKKILLVEDDLTFSRIVKTFLEKNGYELKSTTKLKEAKNLLASQRFDLLIADFRLPDGTGIELLQWSKKEHPDTQVILITHYSDIRIAIKAMKLGAFEYITKPINPDDLLATVQESLALKSKAATAPDQPTVQPPANSQPQNPTPTYVVGNSDEAEVLEKHLQLVAPTDLSVLVLGETGTGKEFISQRIHELSERKNGPFIAIDCGALPRELAGSELFGHVKGAFTGALENKTGHFESARGGTIFLDEIGNLGYEVQVQLLRAIQERTIRKIGGNKEIEVDVRIIAATNENLLQQSGEGHFREDLYHRLNEFSLHAIPLRRRKEDLNLFADHFLTQANQRLNKSVKGFSSGVWEVFLSYPWPGNLRELKNIIKRAVLLTTGELVELDALPVDLINAEIADPSPLTTNQSLESSQDLSSLKNYKDHWQEQEKDLIEKVLKETQFNKSKTARILKMDRKTLYGKMEKYGLN